MEKKKASMWNASERDGVQYRKAKTWELILGLANNGAGIAFYLLMTYASMIATEGYGIVVSVAGVILTCMRIFDGATDTLIAALFEKFNPTKGKIRVFILFGWALCSGGALLMYKWAACRFTGVAGVAMFIFSYFVFIMGYTFQGVGGGTVGTVITNDPTQRPMMSVVSTAYSYLSPLIYTNITTFVILPKYDNQYNADMLAEMAMWYAGITLIFALIACFGVRHVDVKETFEVISKDGKKKDEKITFKDMWSVLKDNRNVQMYLVAGVSDKLAQQTGTQSLISTLLNGVLIGSYAATTMVGNFTQLVGIVFVIFGGVYIAKKGAKVSTVVWSWACIAISGIMILYCLYLGGPAGMYKLGKMGFPLVLWAIFNLAKSGTSMILTTASGTMRADITDYEYERSGHYMPALVAGVYSFIDKFVSSFASMIAAFCITFVGYTTTIPQMGDKPTWPIFWMTMFLVFIMPMIGWFCNIIAMKFYDLDRERMIEVQKNLAERKKQAEQND